MIHKTKNKALKLFLILSMSSCGDSNNLKSKIKHYPTAHPIRGDWCYSKRTVYVSMRSLQSRAWCPLPYGGLHKIVYKTDCWYHNYEGYKQYRIPDKKESETLIRCEP